LIAAREEIRSVEDLAGRTFGIGRLGSLDHSLSTKVLEAGGLGMEAVDLVPLGQPSVRAQALAAGRIDATTMSIGTWLSIPDRTGLHVLVPQEAYFAAVPVVNKVNAVTPEVLAERRDEVVAVVRALTRLSRDFAANPAAWAEAMAPYAPALDDDARLALAESFAGAWSVNGGLDRDELAFTQDWIAGTADFADAPAVSLSDWADFSVVDEVLEEIGRVDPASGSGL
jgi:NitT/TauT family transport system substrate-binding protein